MHLRTAALLSGALSALALALAPAAAQDAAAASGRSAIVIVVENNDTVARGGRDRWLHALDRFGEPLYARLLAAAARERWDRVVVLTDADATFARFAATLRALDAEGYTIDVVLDIHGSSRESRHNNRTSQGPDRLWFSGRPATAADIAALGRPRKLRLNAVYAVSCWGSRFNDAWIEAGARAANGAEDLNYFVLLSPLVFVRAFGAGADLASAARLAYEAEARFLDNEIADRALAPTYGAEGAARIHAARSSRRVQTGPSVLAACRRSPRLF